MTRPEHLKAAGASNRDVNVLLDAVAAIGVRTRLNFSWRPLLSDPDDEMVLETAANGFADMIVTFNLRDFGWAPSRFGILAVQPNHGIRILKV
jgi:predicted nucleic acid-binding protein